MSEPTVVSSKSQLLRSIRQVVLPQTISDLLEVTSQLAKRNIVLEGEALVALGQAFRQLSDVPIHTFESISGQLEPLLKKTDAAHRERLVSLLAEVTAFDLPPTEKARLYETLMKSWNEQVKHEKSIWGDLAKITATVAGGVVLIAAASLGHQHSRPKTLGDAANKLVDKFTKG
jgi:hypothetical protein